LKIVLLFANPNKTQRQLQGIGDGKHNAALRRPIQLGQDDRAQGCCFIKYPRLLERVLPHGGIEHQQGFVRRIRVLFSEHPPDFPQFVHQSALRVEPTSGIGQQDITTTGKGGGVRIENHRGRVRARALCDHLNAEPLTPGFQLLNGGRPESVASGKHHFVPLGLKMPSQFRDGGGLAHSVHADDENHERNAEIRRDLQRLLHGGQRANHFRAEQINKRLAFASGLMPHGGHDLAGHGHPDVGFKQRVFEGFQRGGINRFPATQQATETIEQAIPGAGYAFAQTLEHGRSTLSREIPETGAGTAAPAVSWVCYHPPSRLIRRLSRPLRTSALMTKPSLFLAVCATSISFAAAAATHEFKLENGLKLIVQEDHRAPVAVFQVWYRVGASYEQDGATGLSHALEHMMFKRTKTLATGEFSRLIAAHGGRENAFTTLDYTTYFQQWSADNLEYSFRLEADRMRNLELDAKEFENERKVILEERRMRTDDNPQALAGEATAAAIWQTSPYRQPVIGWAADITNLQLPDLRAWYERWYAPANATVVIVGDVDPATMRQLAERYFGPLPKLEVKPPAPRPEVPQRGEKRLQFKDDKVRVPSLTIAFKAPAMTQVGRAGPDGTKVEEWEIYALEVLAAVLDGGSSARFSRHLLRGKQLAASASASYSALSRLEDLFSLDGTPREGVSLAQLEAAMREEILEIQRQPPTAEELARVKTQVRAQTIYQQDSLFYQAMTIGALDAVGLPWQLKDRYDAAIAAVTPAQVQAAAKKYLVSERSTVAWLSSAGAAP